MFVVVMWDLMYRLCTQRLPRKGQLSKPPTFFGRLYTARTNSQTDAKDLLSLEGFRQQKKFNERIRRLMTVRSAYVVL